MRGGFTPSRTGCAVILCGGLPDVVILCAGRSGCVLAGIEWLRADVAVLLLCSVIYIIESSIYTCQYLVPKIIIRLGLAVCDPVRRQSPAVPDQAHRSPRDRTKRRYYAFTGNIKNAHSQKYGVLGLYPAKGYIYPPVLRYKLVCIQRA